MPSTLAQLRTRLAQRLLDTGNAIWATGSLDESLRAALDEYNNYVALGMETVITLPADGREIALNGISGLLDVTDVWWPYDSDAAAETWPPNKVIGWRVWWDDARPVLILESRDGTQPQQNDEVRLWYTKPHTIQDLDSAAATTLPADHEGWLITGAAGHAALSRTIDMAEQFSVVQKIPVYLRQWGIDRLQEYRAWLATQRRRTSRTLTPFGHTWKLDKWDTET